MIESILTIASGGLAGGIVTYIAREWISARLQKSIQHEYDLKLENHRNDFNLRIAGIGHLNEMHQLKTSLFFDHQRSAFAAIIANFSKAVKSIAPKYSSDSESVIPIYDDLSSLIDSHRLFLDESSLTITDLMLDWVHIAEGKGEQNDAQNPHNAYYVLWYLNKQLGGHLRNQIEVEVSEESLANVALLGAFLLIRNEKPHILADDLKSISVSNIEKVVFLISKRRDTFAELMKNFIQTEKENEVEQKEVRYARRYLKILT